VRADEITATSPLDSTRFYLADLEKTLSKSTKTNVKRIHLNMESKKLHFVARFTERFDNILYSFLGEIEHN